MDKNVLITLHAGEEWRLYLTFVPSWNLGALILAWLLCGSFGTFFARYCKEIFQVRKSNNCAIIGNANGWSTQRKNWPLASKHRNIISLEFPSLFFFWLISLCPLNSLPLPYVTSVALLGLHYNRNFLFIHRVGLYCTFSVVHSDGGRRLVQDPQAGHDCHAGVERVGHGARLHWPQAGPDQAAGVPSHGWACHYRHLPLPASHCLLQTWKGPNFRASINQPMHTSFKLKQWTTCKTSDLQDHPWRPVFYGVHSSLGHLSIGLALAAVYLTQTLANPLDQVETFSTKWPTLSNIPHTP